MLQYLESTVAPIAAENIHGLFSAERVGKTVKIGRSEFGYWASLRDADGNLSPILSSSRKVTRAIDRELEGVVGAQERQAIVFAAFDQCSIIETEGLDDDGNPNGKKHFKLAVQTSGNALSEAQVNASVAKAASFSLKTAMSNRV